MLVVLCCLALAAPHTLLAQKKSQLRNEGDPVISAGAEASGLAAGKWSAPAPDAAAKKGGKPANPASAAGPMVDKTFEGMNFLDNITENGFRTIPPDPMGAAGKSRLVAVVNSMISARTKGGALKWREGLEDFFAPISPLRSPFDPKVLYDEYEDRFVVVALDFFFSGANPSASNQSRFLLAVSKDGNPNGPGDWYFAAVDGKVVRFGGFDFWSDYPGFEIDEEAIYLTSNLFAFDPFGGYGGSNLWIVDKGVSGGFYDGGAVSYADYDPYALAGGIPTTTMPALIHGGGAPGIGTYLVSYSGLTGGGDEFVQVVTVEDPLGTPTFTQQFINLGNIEDFVAPTSLPDAPQPGTSVLIEVNDRRALDAVWRDGTLWMTTTIKPNSGPDVGETTAYWVALNTTGGPGALTLHDQGGIGGEDIAPGTYTYFPAVAVNRDNTAGFGFSASAPTVYAGAYVTGREAGDAPGTVQPSQTVKAGEAPYKRYFGGTRNRWGDYSGMALDPTNEDFFWAFNEFADEPGSPTTGSQGSEDGIWGTAWGRAKFVGGGAGKALAEAGLPEAFRLSANYPNPFNPSTQITFALPEESPVHVTVYDVLGRTVRVLADGTLPAGEHTLTFEASSLPSGTYFYRLEAGAFSEIRKMVLMK